jgi:hypothetical protein
MWTKFTYVKFEVFTAVTMKNAVFWDVTPCKSCVNRRFGGTYRLHLQGGSLGGPLSLSSIPSVWTERWVFVSASHGNLSSAPSRNLRNMTPDLQCYAGQCTLGSLTPRLLGQSSLGSPGFFPPKRSYTGAGLLPAPPSLQTLPTPLYWFPMWPTFPPSLFLYTWVFSTGGSVYSHFTLIPRLRVFLPWRWRRYVPPETSVHTRSTRRHIPEDGILQSSHTLLHLQKSCYACLWRETWPDMAVI